jgi:hypothetical protein
MKKYNKSSLAKELGLSRPTVIKCFSHPRDSKLGNLLRVWEACNYPIEKRLELLGVKGESEYRKLLIRLTSLKKTVKKS